MDTPPQITTIITTYFRPQLLKKAVTSVLNQTYPHFQVCIYDNGSDEETEAIMRDFVKQDSRVKYHRHPENIGMMANYQFAFDRINTPYYSLLSDDDYLLPHFYETALKGFEQTPDAAFSACGVKAENEQGDLITLTLSQWPKEGCYHPPDGLMEMINLPGKLPIPTCTLFQHKLVKDINSIYIKEIQLRWDSDYHMQIAARFPVIITKQTCGYFLAHSNSFSSSIYKQMDNSIKPIKTYLQASKQILQRLEENQHLSPANREIACNYFIKLIHNEFMHYIHQQLRYRKFSLLFLSLMIAWKHSFLKKNDLVSFAKIFIKKTFHACVYFPMLLFRKSLHVCVYFLMLLFYFFIPRKLFLAFFPKRLLARFFRKKKKYRKTNMNFDH